MSWFLACLKVQGTLVYHPVDAGSDPHPMLPLQKVAPNVFLRSNSLGSFILADQHLCEGIPDWLDTETSPDSSLGQEKPFRRTVSGSENSKDACRYQEKSLRGTQVFASSFRRFAVSDPFSPQELPPPFRHRGHRTVSQGLFPLEGSPRCHVGSCQGVEGACPKEERGQFRPPR